MKLSQHKIVTSSLFRAHILQVIESTKLLIGQFRSKKAIQDAFFDLSNERFDLNIIIDKSIIFSNYRNVFNQIKF